MKTRIIYRLAFLAIVLLTAAGIAARHIGAQSQAQQAAPPATGSSEAQHNMPGMDPTVDDSGHHAERGAMSAMSDMSRGPVGSSMHHHMGPHMYMTSLRPAQAGDWEKADEIASEAREAIMKYKDYRVALTDGFRIFLPNIPQPEYHFTNYWNGFLESFSFDPARPTSLLYKKTRTGWELTGVMYTMPRAVSEAQLNERIPLSVAQWHQHTNLCMPAKDQTAHADWSKFGLEGSIITREACNANGGKFYPVIFGWMVHVYPFEDSREKIWGQ